MVRRVVLTRPETQNAALIQRLSGHDIDVLSAPALTIRPVLDPADLAVVPRPDEVDLVVFVSGNAARYYIELCQSRPGWVGWPAGVAGAAVGEATAAALRAHSAFGAAQTLYAPAPGAAEQDSEALWRCLSRARSGLGRVLIVRGQDGRPWLADQLRRAGAQVQVCAVYRRESARWPSSVWDSLGRWQDETDRPAWVYTSTHGITAVGAKMAERGLLTWWAQCPAVVTHSRLAAALAVQSGLASRASKPMVKICLPTTDALFEAIVSL